MSLNLGDSPRGLLVVLCVTNGAYGDESSAWERFVEARSGELIRAQTRYEGDLTTALVDCSASLDGAADRLVILVFIGADLRAGVSVGQDLVSWATLRDRLETHLPHHHVLAVLSGDSVSPVTTLRAQDRVLTGARVGGAAPTTLSKELLAGWWGGVEIDTGVDTFRVIRIETASLPRTTLGQLVVIGPQNLIVGGVTWLANSEYWKWDVLPEFPTSFSLIYLVGASLPATLPPRRSANLSFPAAPLSSPSSPSWVLTKAGVVVGTMKRTISGTPAVTTMTWHNASATPWLAFAPGDRLDFASGSASGNWRSVAAAYA